MARKIEREELTKRNQKHGHTGSLSPNSPRITIQPVQKTKAFDDPSKIQNDEKNNTWNTFNKYP